MNMHKHIISCDLGGTKCAAGLLEYDMQSKALRIMQHTSIKLTDATSLQDLLHQLENVFGLTLSAADAICVGAAGQYDGEILNYAGNYPYRMNFAELARQQKWRAYAIVHDYAPIVCATFTDYLDNPHNVKRLNTATVPPHGRRIACGLGTGLGMQDGVLFPDGNFWLGKNEIGHIGISIPPLTRPARWKMHHALCQFLSNDAPITFEKILSGPGTVRLHQFFYPSQHDEGITPAVVWKKLADPTAAELMDAFAFYLGVFISTLQLAFMPEAGIWITGGVTLHYLSIFDRPAFQEGLATAPAYIGERATLPLGVLKNPEHAIIGGGYYAVQRLLR